jgi:hypothetical protein
VIAVLPCEILKQLIQSRVSSLVVISHRR